MSESNESNEPGKWTVRVLGPADAVPSRSESFTFPTLDEAMEAAVRRWHMHRACGQALGWLPDADSAATPARPTLHEIMNTPMGPADGSGDWNRYHREAAALNATPSAATPAPECDHDWTALDAANGAYVCTKCRDTYKQSLAPIGASVPAVSAPDANVAALIDMLQHDGPRDRSASVLVPLSTLDAAIAALRLSAPAGEGYDASYNALVERSVGAMAIAEGDEGYERIVIDCPMLLAVSELRALYEAAELLAQQRGERIASLTSDKFISDVMTATGFERTADNYVRLRKAIDAALHG